MVKCWAWWWRGGRPNRPALAPVLPPAPLLQQAQPAPIAAIGSSSSSSSDDDEEEKYEVDEEEKIQTDKGLYERLLVS